MNILGERSANTWTDPVTIAPFAATEATEKLPDVEI